MISKGKLNADRRVMKKACTHQPTRHGIYVCGAKLSPDTSLSNADCGLTPTADSTFESALIGAITPTVGVKLRTHQSTAVGRLL